jgi:hypothetical protein
MDRRSLIASGIIVTGLGLATGRSAFAQDPNAEQINPNPETGAQHPPSDDYRGPPDADRDRSQDTGPSREPAGTYSKEELANQVSDFFGVTAENAGALIERLFRQNGRPTAYIAGLEGSGAFIFGLRYGKGLMYMKDRPVMNVFWQGPTGGFDFGGNGSRVFTLCYNLQYPDAIFRRFPGVDGSAYLVGGLGVNYQHADGITLAPIRAGVGLRLGASLGYLAYSRQRNIIPL